ncbi:hypothetical protein [Oceanobacillus kimchii]|uniref:hypothetical protein n=1 Tax=Oceanobacillus kimchii TaxID=746691 RepID=UPI00034B7A2A|nr:hypothetical protein [Oceanobacillus kimchii]
MVRNFRQTKKVIKYLKNRYGNIRKHTIQDDIVLVDDLCNDHSLEEIKMMKNRINASITLDKNNSYLNNYFISLFVAFFTVSCTSIFLLVTIGSQLILSSLNHFVQINQEDINQDNLNELIQSINFSELMTTAIQIAGIVFLFFLVSIFLVTAIIYRNSSNNYMYNTLIEEAFEKKKELD